MPPGDSAAQPFGRVRLSRPPAMVAELPPRDPFPFGKFILQVYRVVVIGSLLASLGYSIFMYRLVTELDQRYVTKELFLEKMQELSRKLDRVGR